MTQTTDSRDQAADFLRAQAYVGMAYEPDVFDCAHLFMQVQRELFGRDMAVPTQYTQHRQGRAGQAAQIKAAKEDLATRITSPEHGCAVLLVSSGDVWHIGVVLLHHCEAWVLHNSRVMGGVALNRLRDFAWRGQRIEGYYLWN